MMFPNRNRAVIRRLTARSLKTNRSRNWFVILAITLTTWLMTSFFSIGLSYYKSFQQLDAKLLGTAAQAALSAPSVEQLKQLQGLKYVGSAGLQSKVGTVLESPGAHDLQLNLVWYDESEWNDMRRPVLDGLKGHYPQADNEIAVPLWVLEAMGIGNPQPGMNVPLTYSAAGEEPGSSHATTFILSGWFTEYSHIRGGDGALLVSESLADSYGRGAAQPDIASVIFKEKGDVDKLSARLGADIGVRADQKLSPNSLMMSVDSSERLSTLAGYGGIVLFVMLSGYLLIYNVLYISVSQDTRYYGLLKTIGMTGRQIKSLVRGQVLRLALLAIPLGLALGALTAFAAVPMALRTTTIETGVEISFHPVIFIGAALFAWITTLIGCRKPAAIAGRVSPVEAAKYTGTAVHAKAKRSAKGSRLHRMALRNIFRNRKRALVVFLSLFMGLSTFLVVTTIVLSMDTDNLVAQYMEHDFVLENHTMSLGYEGEEKEKITGNLVQDIRSIGGVDTVYPLFSMIAEVDYDAEVFGRYVDNFATAYHIERQPDVELGGERGQFRMARVMGLDMDHARELTAEMGLDVDLERFEAGGLALLDDMQVGGISTGDKLQLSLPGSGETAAYEIAGIGDFSSLVSSHMLAPNVYLSEAGIRKLQEQPLIEKLYIDGEAKELPQISAELKALTGGDVELRLESRLEMQAEMKSVKGTLYILGGGIGLILALIGILNYVNLMVTSVLSRKLEFAVLESIGMTAAQMRKLLLLEGGYYALISSGLIATVGTLLSYGAFSLFVQEADYAVFTFPALPLALAVSLVLAVCLTVPLIAYRKISGASVVERLREVQ